MSEWWTYTLSDFLLFSAQTYYRLFALYNSQIWPLQIAALALGIVLLALLLRHEAWQGRVIAAILALCWLWVAWAFHLARYASVNWAAVYFAAGFIVEALLLAWIGIVRAQLHFEPVGSARRLIGLGVFLFALAAQPLIGQLLGRPWLQAEFFGVAPDPTVLATLGILLLAAKRAVRALLPIPLLWCAISGATLWAMGSRNALVMPLAALLVLLLTLRNKEDQS